MTKEEAVKEIEKEEKWLLIAGYSAKNVDIAFDKVKSLIIQLLQEPCEDAVSRQAAIDAIYKMHMNGKEGVLNELKTAIGSDAIFAETIADAVEALEDLPSVNSVKTGHWIRQDNTKEPLYGWYFCSECNSVIGDKTKFCSNCGAKMIEPQEREGTDADNQT